LYSGRQYQEYLVAIWTNFITDEGAILEFALKGDCLGLASWTVSIAQKHFSLPGGAPVWDSTQRVVFTLDVTTPAQITCESRAIVKARASAETVDCAFTAVITPR
jgi:hypothetical protein